MDTEKFRFSCWVGLLFAATWTSGPARGDAASPEELKFFEEKVRPVLATRCQKCHGESKQKGGLRLDSPDALLTGGDSGAAIEPGHPEKSLLIEAIQYESFEMPPDGKLGADEIDALTAWVRMGAPWPAHEKGAAPIRDKGRGITDDDRSHWSFQPVRPVTVPDNDESGWSRNEIDRFILQRQKQAGLSPTAPADRRTLIRRVYFNLIGLPPSPADVESFVASDDPQAYEKLVEGLLNSERHGEKWARHWLDLVRYAESDGFKQDAYRANSWPYRDYVVRAFNTDKPYDQFVREQLAGDELGSSDLDALAATAYLRHWIYEYNQRDVRTQWSNILNDITDVTAEVFLGLSVGCARCHDHKFDPILRRDYYRLQAFFSPLLPRDDVPFLAGPEGEAYRLRLEQWERRTAEIRQQLDAIESPLRQNIVNAAVNKFPPDVRPMIRKPASERTPYEHQLAEMAYRQVVEELAKLDPGTKLKGEEKEKWQSLHEQLVAAHAEKPAAPMALTVRDVGTIAPVTFIPGDRSQRDIPPGYPTVFDPGDAEIRTPASIESTGRRTALADWITSPDNPLTARVIVNRVWQHHFGLGLVSTSSDFGRLGEAPSHPELLDWLTRWFVDQGWSLKKLHRLIVTSATYQQASDVDSSLAGDSVAEQMDPDNRLLWHFPVRRLEAEQIRDATLAVSGELDLEPGGPSVETSQPRRSIYTKVVRNTRDPLLDVFDAPDHFNSTALRNVTTTPTQALLMMNGPWMLQRATAFARRIEQLAGANDQEALRYAFLLAYGRPPTEPEQQASQRFLHRQDLFAGTQEPADSSAASFAPFPERDGLALDVLPAATHPAVTAPDSPALPSADFTVEAFVLLRSLYEDASVRTIVSQWDSHAQHSGWSIGVTSKRSRYEPRNLILQLVGSAKDGPLYEVVPSNLRLELNRPYYVAVSVRIADASDQGVTFYIQDLSDAGRSVQTANVPHKVIKDYRGNHPVVIGGRDKNDRHRWDGLIDDVRLTTAALPRDQLLINGGQGADKIAAFWQFESGSGPLHDTSTQNNHLTYQALVKPQVSTRHLALVDFCHILLNSNEFLYTD